MQSSSCLSLPIVFVLILSCSTAPEFDRDNENDPTNQNFTPDPPTGANYSFNPDTVITISWNDQTEFETGYNIYKIVGDSYKEKVASLPFNSTEFTDNSKEFGFPTHYMVSAEKDGSQSDSLVIPINFGSISGFNFIKDVSSINEPILTFRWIDNISYEDGFFILVKTDEGEVYTVTEVVEPNREKININVPQQGFVHDFKILPFKVFRGDTTVPETKNPVSFINRPENFKMNAISEDSLLFTWNYESNYQEKYILELTTPSGIKSFEIDKNLNSYSLEENLERNYRYNAQLIAVNGQKTSPEVTNERTFNLPPIIIERIDHISSSSIEMEIRNTSTIRQTKNIYRKSNTSEFVKIGEISNNDSTFTDTNLNENEVYTYYFDTRLTLPSTQKKISYSTGSRHINTFPLENDTHFISGSSEVRSATLFLSDWKANELILTDHLTNEPLIRYDYFYPIEIEGHQSQSILAVIKGTQDNISIDIIDNGVSTTIETVDIGDGGIRGLEFVFDKIFYLRNEGNDIWLMKSSTLDGIQKDTLLTIFSSGDTPKFAFNKQKNEVIITEFLTYEEVQLRKYSFNDSELTLERTTTINNYPIHLSPTLDSVLVSKSQNNLSVIDLNSEATVFSQEFSLYNSNSLGRSFFFGDGLIFAPDQASAYVVDTKNLSQPILQEINNYCCSITFAGAFWDPKTNHIVEMRRSHLSGIPDFYKVFSLETFWREVDPNN